MFTKDTSKNLNTQDYDPVFPGENWFFYWKTSPSLWQNKLEVTNSRLPVFVPLFWGFHSEYEDAVDFGSIKPEANLKKLVEIATQVGREVIFLIPTMPMPFLPNGGLPSYVSRVQACDQNGMVITCLDNEQRLNKVYSFYEPKVFLAYKKFMRQLGQFFVQNKIANHCFACENFRGEHGRLVSFLDDSSSAFEQGFTRFIQNNKTSITTVEQETNAINEFKKLIYELYLTCAQENLGNNWSGTLGFSLLGGSTYNIFSRTSDLWEHPGNYFKNFAEIVSKDKFPSTVLLNKQNKSQVLERAIGEFISPGYVNRMMGLETDDESAVFSPLYFLEMIKLTSQFELDEKQFDQIGLKPFLDTKLNHAYALKHDVHLNLEDQSSDQKIFFFNGPSDSVEDLKFVFKLFMNSGKVLLDTSQFSAQVMKKFETFILENNLEKQSVSYLIQVDLVELGDGKLIFFDGKKLNSQPIMKKIGFWERVFSFLDLKNLNIELEEDVFVLWKTRASTPMELNFEEIRRLCLFNPTSYKKKVKIIANKSFALAKISGQENVKVESSPISIDVLMMPNASVNFDFGILD